MFLKKYKKVILLVPIIVLIISLCFFKKNEGESILLFGDCKGIKEHLQEKLDYKIDDSFTLSSLKSKDLLYYLNHNASTSNKNNINDLIKNSSFIVISIGLNDLLSKITIDRYKNSVYFDNDSINLTFSILEQNLFNIIEHIKLVNENTKVLILGYWNPFYFINKNELCHELIFSLNSLMNSISRLFNEFYVENKLNDFIYYDQEFSFYVNELGKQKIAENIYQKIIAITS